MLPPSQVQDDNAHGTIQIPPTDIKIIVDKFTSFMASIQPHSESEKRIMSDNAAGPLRKYAFLYDGDIYHPYYQHQLADLRAKYGCLKTDRIWPKWYTDAVAAIACYQTRDTLKWYKEFAERPPATVVSPITHELVPVSTMFEHMQDPKLKERKETLFAKIRGETPLAKDDEISRMIAQLAWLHPEFFRTTEEEFFNHVKAHIKSMKPVQDIGWLSKVMPAGPEPKRLRLDPDDNYVVVPEDQFLAQHSGPACIIVRVTKTQQKLEISVESLSESVSSLKEKIAGEIGVPANKQKLSGKTGYLEDNLSLAHYNVAGGERLLLWLC